MQNPVFPLNLNNATPGLENFFAKVDAGHRGLLRFGSKLYYVVTESEAPTDTAKKHVHADDEISPELQARIDRAREDYAKGECLTLSSPEEISNFVDSLFQ